MQEEVKPSDYTVKKVDPETGEKKVVRTLPKGHMEIIKKQMKAQAKARHDKYIEEKNKEARRAKNKRARKARKKGRK